MDIIGETNSSVSKSKSFVQHMTEIDKQQKGELINMFQYAFLMIIPVVLLNYGVGEIFSADIEDKSSLELTLEIIGELIVLISGIYIIHRFVTYVPTYSEQSYSEINFVAVVLGFVLVIFSFQTKLNEKVRTVLENIYFQVTGKKPEHEQEAEAQQVTSNPQKGIVVTQPIQKPGSNNAHYLKNQSMIQAPSNTTQSASQVYGQTMQANLQPQTPPVQKQQLPNYDTFYEQEPMAANEGMMGGGSFF